MKGFALSLILEMRIFGTQKAFFPWPPGPCSLTLLGLGLSLHEIVSKQSLEKSNLRKQPTFCNATSGSSAKVSEKLVHKFHIDHASLPRSGLYFHLVMPCGKFASTKQKYYPDLGSDMSSV